LPTPQSTPPSPAASTGRLLAAGGRNPTDSTTGHNQLVIGTPAPPLADASITGSPVTDSSSPAVAITAATKLGGAGAGVLNPPINAGDTIVVDGKTITFNSGSGTTGSAAAGTLS